MSRALHQDLSEVPVLAEPAHDAEAAAGAEAGAGAFIPAQPDASKADAASEEAGSSPEAGGGQADGGEGEALDERQRAVLTFEKQYWKYAGAKEQAIRDRFEMSATRYYQLLNAILDLPAAQEFEPVLVKRLRRQRATRQRARSTRTSQPRPTPRSV
jgi:hypothetical protein